MTINNLFTKEEQMDILWSVKRIKQKLEYAGIDIHRRFYFSEMADDYNLSFRVMHQVEECSYETKIKEITTDKEIAELFEVRISAVNSYLSKRLSINEKFERGKLCLQRGRSNGWEYLKNSGKLHVLSVEDLTKSKKYNGRKKRNNKNS